MHEASFTGQIVQAVLDELKVAPAGHASRVKVNVGEMLHLNSESVRAHFESISKGTALEGVTLELAEIPVRLECPSCLAEDHHLLDTVAGERP